MRSDRQISPSGRLNTRDYINVGVFTALYFAVNFMTAMVGFAGPAFMFVGWALGILLGGIVIALFIARTPKFGALTLLGFINGLLFVMTGLWWGAVIVCTLLGLIADLIVTRGALPSIAKRVPWAYAVFSLWLVAPLFPVLFNADAYYAGIESQMGADYSNGMRELFQTWVIGVWTICIAVLGYFGGLLGVRATAKHFARSGLA
ncbi:MptD family putative ECF transporter S component [Gephyromycinifex aptenodytis]|uniref:MptD family putative ECF transporter S component n=1 Tax=Gephyromycinifex aptenodytis TaxID=2716227 RepID=UPI0014481C32|nr:MptD family putative ECF transporter S component [Gephyromycinifex aptenodytis]